MAMDITYHQIQGKTDSLGMPCYEFRTNGVVISTDASLIDMQFVLKSLAQAYWANTRPDGLVRRTWDHSLGFGVYDEVTGTQMAMMRVVTDYGHYCHVFDVWVDPNHRSKGYSKLLMSFLMTYPELKDVKRFQLTTSDAHTLYNRYGFDTLRSPNKFLEYFRNQDTPPPNMGI